MATQGSREGGMRLILGLYRSILRLHREKLVGGPMRELGDTYARAEFSAHLKSSKTTQQQWAQFVEQWQGYVVMLRGGPKGESEHSAMAASMRATAEGLQDMLSPEQALRMEALRKEAGGLGKSIMGGAQPEENAAPVSHEDGRPLQ